MKKLSFLLGFLLVLISGGAQASVILSDSFDSATSGLNDNLASRQAGSEATQNWLSAGNFATTPGISLNQLQIDPTGNSEDGNVWLDLDLSTTSGLVDGGAFTISFDMTANSNYSGFFIGDNDLGVRPVIGSNDFKMIIKTADVGSGKQSWVFTFDTDDFNSGSAYTASLTIDDSAFNLGTKASGTWDGGAQYVGFTSRTSDTFVDNFELVAVPEPSALLLAVAGLLGCGLFRRRK